MDTQNDFYNIDTNNFYHPKIKCNIRIGDIVIVERWGYHYPSYRAAFNFFKMLDNSSLEIERKMKKHYIVLGLVVHENNHDVIAHIASRDNKHYIINIKGLKKIGEIKNDNLINIRKKYIVKTLNRNTDIKN
jgi:translation initiation factor IF-1